MSESPKEKLTVADLVEAQRETAEQLKLLNEKLSNIDTATKALATTDFRAINPVWDVVFFVLLAIGSAVNKSFIGFELAILVYIGIRLLHRTPAMTRAIELDTEQKEFMATREAEAKEWEKWFGRKKNKKTLTPPSA